ncbi:MAG: LuxR C-terminal-related transcriptional regulator [Actinomycetota bacterium]
MDPQTVSVVIAAGHGVVGEVVRRACEAERGVVVVGEVRDGTALLEACRSLRPDVIVLDEGLDGGGRELRALRSLREEGVAVAAVVLTDRSDGASVLYALRLGARGYVRKAAGLAAVGSAVRTVADGGRAIEPESEQAAILALGRFAQQAREGSEVEASLTAREHEILMLVSQGLTMQQAARRLGISPRTVETHVAKLYRKLGVRTRVQAVARAVHLGLIEP